MLQIKNVMIWDVLNEENTRCGQAATFTEWVKFIT